MSWPLTTRIRFPALESLSAEDAGAGISYVSLRSIANEDELEKEIVEALTVARRERATILLLPELCVTPKIQRTIQNVLRSPETGGYPVLTLLGCCHRPNASEDLDVNEAVLLGPDGAELHRHKKLAAFSEKLAERLEVGDALSVLESPLGNLVPLICLDLFHEEVTLLARQSHGNVFLVPSWTDKTSAHDTAAKQLQGALRASTFVCNRRFTEPLHHPEGTSFYRVPRRGSGARVAHFPTSSNLPYLLFELKTSSTLQLVVK